MSKKLFKIIGSLTLALTMLFSLNMTAFAYTLLDTDKTGSITVSPQSGQSLGTSLTLYRVADVVVDDADQKYELTSDFADSAADLTSLDDSAGLAQTLYEYAQAKKLSGESKDVSGDGTVKFENLPLGLYLIVQEAASVGGSVVNPFLVSVPAANEDETGWIYDVTADPKAESYELVDVTVHKVWNDGKKTDSRPSSISVSMYKDEALLDTVTLDSANDWSYTWSGLEKSDGYSVSEADVKNYAATYSQSGYDFTITNTSKLAQTGQLNWPVPLLAGCGVVLFAIGWAIVYLKKKKA